MAILSFPPIEDADETGLLAIGGDLEVESLILAYSSGIYPWPVVGWDELPWFSPPQRAVLFLEEFTPGNRLQRRKRNCGLEFRFNSNFSAVIRACAASVTRKSGPDTWIKPEIINAYEELHQAGYCHSVECYRGQKLVGGLYGVSIGAMFAGESMFYLEPDASKLSLWFLVESLKSQGVSWIDCQQLTPILQQLGARLVPRRHFLEMVSEAISKPKLNF